MVRIMCAHAHLELSLVAILISRGMTAWLNAFGLLPMKQEPSMKAE